jgi:two-component system cell cycle sensor histidine kinase/response regulator CckA
MESPDRIQVLLVEDSAEDAAMTRAQLAAARGVEFQVDWVKELDKALLRLHGRGPDVILLDLGLAGVTELGALAAVRAIAPAIPVVVLTGQTGDELEAAVLRAGAHDFLVKSQTDPSELRRALVFAVDHRRRLELQLAESQQQLAMIFDASPEAIALESNERLSYVNPAYARLYGYGHPGELVGLHVSTILAPESVERMLEMGRARVRGEAVPTSYEFTGLRRDGSRVEIAISISSAKVGERSFIISIERDITQHRQLEAQLRQSQRMEAVGRLAGGIAHDFNNLLTAISGFGQLTLEALPPEDPLRRNLEEIHRAADRAAGLTRQLLAFSRQQILKPRVLDLNGVVGETLEMLRRVIGEDIAIETDLAPDLGRIRADPGSMVQVLMNLAVNARDAMPQGGRLRLRTANQTLTSQEGAGAFEVRAGEYVALEIADTGTGMTPEILMHIFDPFFTTKEVGKGTGLGLSTVYGIVKQSGGYIWAKSEPGLGARFHLYLPRVDEAVEKSGPAVDLAAPVARGEETVLVVEDEAAVRALVRTILRSRGYQVLVAGNGREALERIADFEGTIDLLLTDVVMPEMSGRDLAELVVARHPEIQVLYMSGYTTDVISEGGLLEPGVNFLQKPFGPDLLGQTVRQLLDGAR